MKLRFRYIMLLQLLISFSVQAQNCKIIYRENLSIEIKKNNIKEIEIFKGDSILTSQLEHHYFFNSSGCVEKHIYNDFYSPTYGQIIETVNWNKNLQRTYISSRRLKNDSIRVYQKEISSYTNTNKLISTVLIENIDLTTETINLYDTTDTKHEKINSIFIKSYLKDTLQIITHFYDYEIREYIIKNKSNGQWRESEKTLTTYNDKGKRKEYWLYKNEKLFQHETDKSLSEKIKSNEKEDFYNESTNPLPFVSNVIDTIYTNDLVSFKPTNKNDKNASLYFVVLHYEATNRDKIQFAEIYFSETRLFFRQLNIGFSAENKIFRYTFRSPE